MEKINHVIKPGEESREEARKTGKILWWGLLILGLVAGSGGSLIGVGGGVVMVPVLTMWGIKQKAAQGTSLAVIMAMVPVSIFLYYQLGNINLGFALPLAIGGVIGAWLGSTIAARFSNRILAKAFGFFLILVAIRMLVMNNTGVSTEGDGTLVISEIIEGGLLGVLAGLVAGFFGVGGGIVFVPTGVLLAGLSQVVAQGSSFTAMFPTTLTGVVGYQNRKLIEWDLFKWLVPGAIIGAMFGSYAADILPGKALRVIFAVYLLYTGIRRVLPDSGKNKKGQQSADNTA